MKNRQCCGTHFLICSSLMLKLRAEVLLLSPPKKKLPRPRLLTNRLLRNLPRQVEKESRARSLRKATEQNRAASLPPRRGSPIRWAAFALQGLRLHLASQNNT